MTRGTGSTAGVDPHRRLAGEIIRRAREDMQSRVDHKHRVSGTCWLASVDATPWFDLVGVDQRYCLNRIGWTDHAERLLRDSRRGWCKRLSTEERRFLRTMATVLAQGSDQ